MKKLNLALGALSIICSGFISSSGSAESTPIRSKEIFSNLVMNTEDDLNLASQILSLNAKGHNPQKITETLESSLHAKVIAEIATEANAAEQTRDQYIAGAQSFVNFVSTVKKLDLEKLSRAEKLLLLIKTGIRFQIQLNVRFEPEGHEDRILEIQQFSELLMKQLNLNQ
jgi:hypothetical protein